MKPTNKIRIGILIAVRMSSKRLPKKALAMIEDQTLIEHLIDRVKLVKNADDVVVCTSTNPDDKVLTRIAEKKGIKWFRGEEDNVLKRFIDCAEREKLDIVVRVTGDNPLTSPDFIEKAIKHHLKSGAEYTSTTELPQGTKGEVINVSALKRAHELAEDPNTEFMTWYFTENSKFFKMEKVPVDKDMKRPNYRLTVDYPEDLELIREIYRRLYKPGSIIPLKKIIKLLDDNPELLKINVHVRKGDEKNKVNVRLREK